MADETGERVPSAGEWPVDPQDDVAISKGRIWIDGCFDFAHHGHAGALLQARKLGTELITGIHSDEAILHHKGPTVMNLKERVLAADACRWSTMSVPKAPYVTVLPWISHYGCYYVAHGDDITSDSSGEDCYRYVKAAGRFLVFKRTPSISTTDLVGRILLCTKNHFIKSLQDRLSGKEGEGDANERRVTGESMTQRIRDYASDASGSKPHVAVYIWGPSQSPSQSGSEGGQSHGSPIELVEGIGPQPGQRIVYVDGGFDLFSSGHIAFLQQVIQAEQDESTKQPGGNPDSSSSLPPFIIAGIHDDLVMNERKGVNYPIMNIFERGLCVLQCRYINCVIFSAPYTPSKTYLTSLPFLPQNSPLPNAIYHGPTTTAPSNPNSDTSKQDDPYADAKTLGIFHQIQSHEFQHVNAGEIAQRILRNRELYEERQRKKGVKAIAEAEVLKMENEGKTASA